MAKSMASDKFIKGVASMNNVVKALAEGGPQMAAVAVAMELLKPIMEAFAPLIELLQTPLEVMSGILQMALVPTIQALAPLMTNFNMMLMQNKDSIIILITVLNPLMLSLKFLTIILNENKAMIIEVQNAFGELITVTGELIAVFLEDEDVMYLFKVTVQGLSLELKAIVIVMRTVADGVRWLKNLFTDLKGIMSSIRLPSLGGGGGGGGGGGDFWEDVGDFLGLQGGGLITAPTIAKIGEEHKPEAVFPLDRLERLLNHADPELLYYTEKTNNKLDILIGLSNTKRTVY